jgi:histidine ammonia-lyase
MVQIGGKRLTSADFYDVLYNQAQVTLQSDALEKVKTNFNFLQAYSKDKIIYGINTGLGPMAQYKISEDDQRQLQYNLIRSHSAGSGEIFSEDFSRATMLARLNSLMQGASGIHADAVELLSLLLNKRISVSIFQRGGVGASGDLVQLAHLALNLIGEGEVLFKGRLSPAKSVFTEEKIKPLQIYLREGLAIMNGTSAMTGVGMVNLIHAKRLLDISIMLSAITNELMKSFDDHFSMELNGVKHHPGQQKIAAGMQKFLADSKLIRKRPEHLYHQKAAGAFISS